MAKLYFYYAAMNAGKSTTLLQADFNYRERGMETMLWTAAQGWNTSRDGEVYVPYFDMKVVFDDSHARELLEPAGIRAPRLADYFGALIDYAEATRWGKRPMSRQAARERMEPATA